jgi:tetratricopeptide (TPR) repeat protein
MALVALEMAPQADESRRCALLLALGDAQSRGGDAPSAKESFARAADLARRLGEAEQLARAALGYGGRFIWFRAGPERRLVPLLEDALAALPEPGPLRARLLARLPGALRDDPSPARRTALSREAVALARQLGDAEALTYALEGMYAASCWPRETDAWLAMGRELVQLGAQTGEREREFFGRVHGFGAFMVRGNVDEARVELEAMAELGRELRQPAQHWALSISRGTLALFTGRLDEAERQMRQVGEVGSGAQGLDATFYYALNLQAWALRREQGRLAEAEASLEEFVESYPNFVHYPNLIVASIMTNLHSELGRREQARAELGRILGRALPELELGTEWFFGVALLAETCWTVGATEHSADVYEALLPYADHNVFAHPEIARGSASRQLGLLAATMSRWNEAWRHFDDALEMNERMGARTWLAHTEHEYAQALIANGVTRHRERARELLAAARDRYRELGMTSWAERAEADQTRV